MKMSCLKNPSNPKIESYFKKNSISQEKAYLKVNQWIFLPSYWRCLKILESVFKIKYGMVLLKDLDNFTLFVSWSGFSPYLIQSPSTFICMWCHLFVWIHSVHILVQFINQINILLSTYSYLWHHPAKLQMLQLCPNIFPWQIILRVYFFSAVDIS